MQDLRELKEELKCSEIPVPTQAMILDACEKQAKNTVDHPAHYNIQGRKECIEEMIDKYGKESVAIWCELNVYKYMYRHELKNGEQDLQKAEWYRKKAKELRGETDGRCEVDQDYN